MAGEVRLTDAQRAAACDRIGENLALRSGAGCGKTFVLARRFVELLRGRADADNALARLVALTFTEKAALEMSARVRRMLSDAAADAGPELRPVLLSWLGEMPEARISTIHSFCAALLRGRAVEAGIDPSFAVCSDELLVEQMIAEAAEEALLAAVEAGRDDVAELLAGASFDSLAELVRTLIDRRTDCDLPGLSDPAAVIGRWRGLIDARRGEWLAPLGTDAALRAAVEDLTARPCSDPGDRLYVFREEQLAVVGQILADPAAATGEQFALLNDKPGGIGSPKAWGKDEVRDVRAGLKELIGRVRQYAVFTEDLGEADETAARHVAALARLALEAEGLYARQKRRRGLLDFTDLLACTERLLAEQPATREALARQIDQLLVDECQDTNEFQLRLLGRLIDLPHDADGAPPAGRLFVVGDAKQSIYRFRGAQVEGFRRLCDRIGEGNQEHLALSFRTHEAGIEFVNHLFGPLMGADYEPISAHRTLTPPQPSVEVLLAAGTEREPIETADDAARAQAALTAERIRQMLDGGERLVWDAGAEQWRPVEPRDIAILFARMTRSLDYERELQQRGVSYYVVAGTGFFQQQEVFDVLNALAAIDNPLDDVALFGAFRSSLFGLDDNALMHLAEACGPPYFPALSVCDLSGRVGEDPHEALRFAVELIGRLHRGKDAVGIDRLLEELLAETGYEATLLSGPQGKRRLGNVRMVIDRARAASADGLSLAEFLAQMQELVLNESRYEQAAVAGEYENVVRLMTIHKAKGLEFPVVVLPDLNAGRRGAGGRLLIRSDLGVVLKPAGRDADGEEPAAPLSYRLARRLEDEADEREALRKLYVAATRHRDHLVFVGADWRTADGRLRDADGYLAQMDTALGITDAIGAGQDTIPYAAGRFAARVARRAPGRARGAPRKLPLGTKLLRAAGSGAELAEAVARAARGPSDLPRVGPLPPETGRVEIAVTALNDFLKCPMLYRWRHELRVPAGPAGAAGAGAARAGSLDAATVGTLYHLCMERLDFAHPQDAASLLAEAATELDLPDPAAAAALTADLDAALERLRRHPLWAEISSARKVFRELDFVMDCSPAVLRGQIDLIFQDAAGAWHVVDYKSDRVDDRTLPLHAAGYELQVLIYAAAAARHVGVRPAEAELYFLRPGASRSFEVTEASLAGVEARAAAGAIDLIAARRAGRFRRAEGGPCDVCPCAGLCRDVPR
ncbi:MAG TPA: UvrD-helicase domain-containing protein [Phycisphaerae bacterium]|nr:UvrD-helicase domain-containing protein [Phycisphaerae bacterium]